VRPLNRSECYPYLPEVIEVFQLAEDFVIKIRFDVKRLHAACTNFSFAVRSEPSITSPWGIEMTASSPLHCTWMCFTSPRLLQSNGVLTLGAHFPAPFYMTDLAAKSMQRELPDCVNEHAFSAGPSLVIAE
jgi:hypothetical protein